MSRPWILLLAALLAVLMACSEPERTTQRQIFADASAPIWSAATLESEREIETWDLAGQGGGGGWNAQGARFDSTALGWVLGITESPADGDLAHSANGAPTLGVNVRIDAGLVDMLELRVEAAPALGRVELSWLFVDGDRPGRGHLALDLSLFMADRLRATLRDHPEWRGEIRRLEWRFSRLPDGQRLLVRGLRAIALEPDSRSLAEALSKSWRVDIDRDLRPAILTLPGLERRIPIRVPPTGRFRASLGATADRAEQETTFLIRLEHRQDFVELWRRTLGASEWGAWQDFEIDLEPWAGKDVTLELLVEAEAWKPGEGLPAWGGPELISATTPEASAVSASKPDLILISADTLRADHLSLYGYGRETSPILDRWARRNAILFRHAVAPSPWTLPSHISMFTGLDPLSHGGNYGLPATARFEMLAERLRGAGYKTYAETGGGYLHPAYGLGQGFDVFRYPASQVPGPRDLADAVERAIAFAEAQPGPIFLFLHSYETHEPYSGREEHAERLGGRATSDQTWVTQWVPPRAEEGYAHRRRFAAAKSGEAPEDLQSVIDLYDARVANLDEQLAPLFDWLDQKERRTGLVFTSDHGESLGEDGRGGHASLEKQLLHIPLLLVLPDGQGAGQELEARVRLYDVMPTLLEMAGVDIAAEASEDGRLTDGRGLDGESLLDLLENPKSRESWAASPSTNAGIALDDSSDPRWRFRFQPESWAPGGFARFESLVGEDSAPAGSTPDVSESGVGEADLDQALRKVLRRLEEEADGLEVLVVNEGPGVLILDLGGSAVQNHRVKNLESSPIALEWRGQVEGARIRLEEGERRRLLLATPRRGDLVLRTREALPGGSEKALNIQLDLGSDRLPMSLQRGEKEWRRSQGETPPRSGIRLRWLGEVRVDGEGGDVDLELQRQLRALGYTG